MGHVPLRPPSISLWLHSLTKPFDNVDYEGLASLLRFRREGLTDPSPLDRMLVLVCLGEAAICTRGDVEGLVPFTFLHVCTSRAVNRG